AYAANEAKTHKPSTKKVETRVQRIYSKDEKTANNNLPETHSDESSNKYSVFFLAATILSAFGFKNSKKNEN
ncbi:hypothetical protein LNP00_06365, partial [Fructobacillus sp. M158]|uniref:hypothetical protein n=1 Tax=Fructobacillus parabroussonetiae TaxID=2713174 RepID=UPI00200B7A97